MLWGLFGFSKWVCWFGIYVLPFFVALVAVLFVIVAVLGFFLCFAWSVVALSLVYICSLTGVFRCTFAVGFYYVWAFYLLRGWLRLCVVPRVSASFAYCIGFLWRFAFALVPSSYVFLESMALKSLLSCCSVRGVRFMSAYLSIPKALFCVARCCALQRMYVLVLAVDS